ncbi:MAG: SIS domain-containing protein [archaeon]|nr:SIS domain-containing protein [archaeon]
MDVVKTRSAESILDELIERYPRLSICRADIQKAYDVLLEAYKSERTLLVAGNGGSAADSDHISGELTKSFMFKRAIKPVLESRLAELYGSEGEALAESLEGGLAAVPLPTMNASNSAFANDVNWGASFAQLVNALGHAGDVFLGITTSGNSKNIVNALMVSKAIGVRSIALTGNTGGRCRELADVCIIVPETETFKIQELHLPIYHALCAMVEAELFEPRKNL